jgi:two-component system cell cycle sensor histidine kinase/response regulator CckA
LYEGTMANAAVTAGQLLGIPVLLVMAVFYGVALETITVERAEKSTLLKDVEALKQTEEQLLASKSQLEARIKGLKDDLAHANEDMREGLAMRQGLTRRLREAQKMEHVGRIAAGIAGEFGELFAVIGKQTGVMLSQLKLNDPLRTAADEIFQTGEKAAALTAQLIALNLDGGEARQVLSLQSMLMELEGPVRSLLPDRVDLSITVGAALACVEVDREGLEKVLLQLVVNSRDAMPDGGRLAIEARMVSGQEEGIQHAGAETQVSRVLLQVSDTGTGMNLDTQAHMFEPFFSTKETNIGLGLTSVYGIVKQQGGTVEVESRPGQGTVVRVWLPAGDPARTSEAMFSKSMLAKGDETILVVDEDEIGRKLTRSVLIRHKYRVLEAASPVEALMLAQRYKGIVHLTVSPLTMPEIGGRELARRLLNHHPMMKALFVSSYGDETIEHHRINRRFVLQQPYRHLGLVEKVRELLDVA